MTPETLDCFKWADMAYLSRIWLVIHCMCYYSQCCDKWSKEQAVWSIEKPESGGFMIIS